MDKQLPTTNEEWKERLTPEQYQVMREKGTEAPFTGKYYATKEGGVYRCAACGNELFSSDAKFDSGTGWPSYSAPIARGNVKTEEDRNFGLTRTEVMCSRCGAHLGHVFDDGPDPTGKRYCINSVCLDLEKKIRERNKGHGVRAPIIGRYLLYRLRTKLSEMITA